jgi:hypothetical protein
MLQKKSWKKPNEVKRCCGSLYAWIRVTFFSWIRIRLLEKLLLRAEILNMVGKILLIHLFLREIFFIFWEILLILDQCKNFCTWNVVIFGEISFYRHNFSIFTRKKFFFMGKISLSRAKFLDFFPLNMYSCCTFTNFVKSLIIMK